MNISGREAHVLHSRAAGIPRDVYERDRQFDTGEWDSTLDGLRTRGLVDETGALTESGWALKKGIEETTDDLADAAFRAMPSAQLKELVQVLQPLARAVVSSGELPMQSPMGLDLAQAEHAPVRPWVRALDG